VLPGDTVQQATSAFVRVTPLVTPVMHPVRINIHHWYVPHRIVWEDFEDFITGGPDGLDASVFPTITFGGGSGAATGSLADYLGVTPGVNNLEVSALPFRGYAKIYNEWYRDQDLMSELTIDETSGPDTTTNTDLKRAAWEKDPFTAARPWEQKGPSISLPLGTEAPIFGDNMPFDNSNTGNNLVQVRDGQGASANLRRLRDVGSDVVGFTSGSGTGELKADLTNATASTINELREAFALQRYQEMRARYGSRYTEYLRYLGVKSSDGRLQRPEYLGGGRQNIQFSEVLQTAPDSSTSTVTGTLRGHGIGSLRSNKYRRFIDSRCCRVR